ncbi:MliC family protein [Neisseria dentiae]|uniref:MliC family protein n=1 Tax=Neisseria dentiae TaxID=194197 RepID=UPI0035A13041
MKAKLCLSVAAALMLSACVAPYDYDYYDDDRTRIEDDRRYDDRNRRDDDRDDDRYDNRDNRSNRYDHDNRNSKASQGTRYSCRNGLSVSIRQLDSDRIELRLDDKRTVMTIAPSGSGSRYVSNRGLFGTGAQWHEKGGSAMFDFTDPYGNEVETTCRVS